MVLRTHVWFYTTDCIKNLQITLNSYLRIGMILGSSLNTFGDFSLIRSIALLICIKVQGMVATEKYAFYLLWRLWLTVSMLIFSSPIAVATIPVIPGQSSVVKMML